MEPLCPDLAPAVGQTATAQQSPPEGRAALGLAARSGPAEEAASHLWPSADAVAAAHRMGSRGEGGDASSEAAAAAAASASAPAEQLSELSGAAGSLVEEAAAALPTTATATAISLPAPAATAVAAAAEPPRLPCPGQIPNSPPPLDLPSLFERRWWLSAPAEL